MPDGRTRKILIITQAPPADSGRGTRMRIGMAAEALARLGDVSLLIVTQRALVITEGVPEKYRTLCANRVLILRDTDARPAGRLRALLRRKPKLLASWNHDWAHKPELSQLAGDYDLVWVFRLRMWPIFDQLQERQLIRSQTQILDVDDVESKACYRRAMLLGRSLGRLGFVQELLESFKLRISEAQAAKAFSKILVCSELDKEELETRITPRNIGVLPNGIRIPCASRTDLSNTFEISDPAPVILFVGSLDFYPNVEGLLWTINEVLHLLRKPDSQPFRFVAVGRNPDARLITLAEQGVFELHADVPDVTPYYTQARVVIAPIHAGSGTRIKILEAFSFGVPVVSTTLGAEGLGTQNGVHLALADTPAAFAQHILKLLEDPAEARTLSRNAARLLAEHFALDAICARIASLVNSVLPSKPIMQARQ